jgi:hypothetical protein
MAPNGPKPAMAPDDPECDLAGGTSPAPAAAAAPGCGTAAFPLPSPGALPLPLPGGRRPTAAQLAFARRHASASRISATTSAGRSTSSQ